MWNGSRVVSKSNNRDQIKSSEIEPQSPLKDSEKAMTINIIEIAQAHTTMDFPSTTKNAVTPLSLHTDEKSPSCGCFAHQHDSAYSCLSPPPPPQGRRFDDTERKVSSMNNRFATDLPKFPSLSAFNVQVGHTSSGRIPKFKLQPKRGDLPCLHDECFK
jgi:hypothetical protein